MPDKPLLSILLPTISIRNEQYTLLMQELLAQSAGKPVEILACYDNQRRVIGDKRNDLVRAAAGQFLVFVDDDDLVVGDFVDALLVGIANNQGADCITFDRDVTVDGVPNRRMECRVGQGEEWVNKQFVKCSPNHIAIWRSELVKQIPFPSLNMGEDNSWYGQILTRIREHGRIDRVLYTYRFDHLATETQRPGRITARTQDVVLSILIPTVPARLTTFWPKLTASLLEQIGDQPVELLGFFDNHFRTVGEKRNELLRMARGRYLTFVDDDDQVADCYVTKLLNAINQADPVADVIVFDQLLRPQIRNRPHKLCRYGVEYKTYNDGSTLWTGPPAHTQCWRTELAKQVAFPGMNYTEDSAWVKQAVQLVEKQYRIEGPPLYYYDFCPQTSETRKSERRNVGRK